MRLNKRTFIIFIFTIMFGITINISSIAGMHAENPGSAAHADGGNHASGLDSQTKIRIASIVDSLLRLKPNAIKKSPHSQNDNSHKGSGSGKDHEGGEHGENNPHDKEHDAHDSDTHHRKSSGKHGGHRRKSRSRNRSHSQIHTRIFTIKTDVRPDELITNKWLSKIDSSGSSGLLYNHHNKKYGKSHHKRRFKAQNTSKSKTSNKKDSKQHEKGSKSHEKETKSHGKNDHKPQQHSDHKN